MIFFFKFENFCASYFTRETFQYINHRIDTNSNTLKREREKKLIRY